MVEIDELVHSRRKTLSVSVDAVGKVTVRAPMRASEREISAFLATHEAWIIKKKTQRVEQGIELPSEDLEGYTLLLLGKRYEVRGHDGGRIVLDSEHGRLFVPKKNMQKRLIGWLKENALRICKQAVEKKSTEMGVEARSVAVSSARSFWGICTQNNALRFSYRLLYAPKEVLEYVVVHELAHVKYKNHSSAFWKEVERYVPDWKTKRKWLKDRVALMRVL